MRFTDILIKNLKPEEKKYYKREADGFTIRVMPSGAKTWLYIYTFEAKRKEMNLGHYPQVTLSDARRAFNAAYEAYKNGKDPAAIARDEKEARIKAPTVSDLVTEYLERHSKRFKRSWQKDEQILNRDIIPAWGKRKAEDIRKRDVIAVLETIIDRGSPAMANNAFAIIRKMFNYAVEKDILEQSPCAGVKLPAPKIARDRTLSEDEIRTFWEALNECAMSNEVKRSLKLILVTAQRPGEVIGMHTREIDGRWWTVPAERAKNGRTHRIYLSDLAMELIGDDVQDGYIFKCPTKAAMKAINPNALAVAVGRNLEVEIESEDGTIDTINRFGINHFTPHDLRRTAATFMAEMGVMDEVIDAILNHSKQGIIRVYNQYRYDKEKQTTLEQWSKKLQGLLNPKTAAKVIYIKRPSTG